MNSDDIVILANEITTDPLGRAYAGMSNTEVVTDMKIKYRTMPRTSVSDQEILNATDVAELAAISADGKMLYGWILGLGSVDLSMTNIKAMLGLLFPAGSDTRTAFMGLVNSTIAITRPEELGIPDVTEGDVIIARGV